MGRAANGVGKCVSWAAAGLLLVASSSLAACGSDPEPTPQSPQTGQAGEGGSEPSTGGSPTTGGSNGEPQAGTGASSGSGATGGSDSPVTPGDLVCNADADCHSAEKPVCDQVKGCVACQYDWDCPANHRCNDNQCFEKHPCESAADCKKDAGHPVCDAVQQLCVGCREDADCGDGKRCDASECVAFEACSNSRACKDGKVCDRQLGACVACVVDGDCGEGSACVHNACVPTCHSDKECLGIGLLCDAALGRCVECVGHGDCPEQYFCAAGGHCTLDVCEKDQARCNSEHELGTCAAVGDQFVGSTCGGDTRCVEDGKTASCVPLTCSPGSTQCSDDLGSLVHCSADGLTIASTEPCPDGQACDAGACHDVQCPPNGAVCDENYLYHCNAAGTDLVLDKYCGNGSCDEETGTCKARVCTPSAPACDGTVATVCAPDGLALLPGGTDCATSDQACYNGACAPIVCEGSYACSGSLLQQCKNNGTALTPVKDCGFAALCDATGAKCTKPTCTPSSFVCDGNVATRCKADGSGYADGGTDCAKQDKVCDGGGCLPKVCTPGAAFCAGGNPQQCSASGATYEANDVCSASEYCAEGSSYCLYDKCTANSALCNGNLATTCASDGSGPVAGGSDCSTTGQVCENGACKAITCTPGAYSCQGEAVYVCNKNGTGTSLYDSCYSYEFCDSSAGTAVCSPDVCSAGALGCNGEVISTCGANGGSWTKPGTDCKATSQVCITGGTCAAQEVATQSATTSSVKVTNQTSLAAFRALTSRKLTKLEVSASFAGLQKLTWVVYQKRDNASTFDLVYQTVTAQSQAVLGVIASPALDFTFESGKSYAVGVHIAGGATVSYSYYGAGAAAAFVTGSFASTAGGGSQPDASIAALSSGVYYAPYLRLTTVLP